MNTSCNDIRQKFRLINHKMTPFFKEIELPYLLYKVGQSLGG